MYNIFHRAQNKRLMLKSYNTGINTPILPKKHDGNIFSEKLVDELNSWIENHVIHSSNLKDSLFVKINDTLVKKQKYLLQI